MAAAAQPLVSGVQVLEDYRDAKLGEGKKGMLWSIRLPFAGAHPDGREIDAAHEAIVARLIEQLPAQRRVAWGDEAPAAIDIARAGAGVRGRAARRRGATRGQDVPGVSPSAKDAEDPATGVILGTGEKTSTLIELRRDGKATLELPGAGSR